MGESRAESRAEQRAGAMKKTAELTVVMGVLLILALIVQLVGCGTPVLTASPQTTSPQTVIPRVIPRVIPHAVTHVTPHAEFGYKIVIVPVGTMVGDYKTVEPGLYMTADVVISLFELREDSPYRSRYIPGGRH